MDWDIGRPAGRTHVPGPGLRPANTVVLRPGRATTPHGGVLRLRIGLERGLVPMRLVLLYPVPVRMLVKLVRCLPGQAILAAL